MHVFTHLKKESVGKTGLGVYPDGMVENDAMVGQIRSSPTRAPAVSDRTPGRALGAARRDSDAYRAAGAVPRGQLALRDKGRIGAPRGCCLVGLLRSCR